MILPLGDESYTRRVPVVNIAIIAINVIVFAFVNVFSGPGTPMRVFNGYGVVPGNLQWYQFFTCMFLHGGWMHIIGNMWFLWIFGDAVENRIGHLKYLIFYLAAGIGASAFYLVLTPRNMIPCVGASGAIFGVVGAYAILYPRNEVKMFYWIGWIWAGTFHIRAMWIIGFWFLEQIGMYFLMKGMGGGGVAHAAHLGGGIVGVAVAILVRSFLPEPEVPDDWDTGSSNSYGVAPAAFDIPGKSPSPAFVPIGDPSLTAAAPEGPYSKPAEPIVPRDWIEGPSAIDLGGRWIVYFDCYRKGCYGAAVWADLEQWDDITAQLKFPGRARHGTILRVDRSVVDRLKQE